MDNYLIHYGTPRHSGRYPFGSGEEPFQSLTPRQKARLERKDSKWADRHSKRFYNTAYKQSRKEMKEFVKNELNPAFRGKYKGAYYNNAYNRKLAQVMNTHVDNLPTSPSGKVVRFVAKRGDVGVLVALADKGYDMSQVKNGVFASGKVAYKNENVGRI